MSVWFSFISFQTLEPAWYIHKQIMYLHVQYNSSFQNTKFPKHLSVLLYK